MTGQDKTAEQNAAGAASAVVAGAGLVFTTDEAERIVAAEAKAKRDAAELLAAQRAAAEAAHAAAEAEAAQLRAQGLEVSVQPVPAYSTLGWLNWAGGDPLLNTFIGYPEGALARLIFHELAHQRVYVAGDMPFNESFATAVEQLGGARWLAAHGSPATQAADALAQTRRRQFRALTLDLQQTLRRVYEKTDEDIEDRRILKAAALKDFARRYAELKAGWGGYAGYDRWADQVNNATLGAMSAYDALVPGFEALFEKSDHDWPRFYAAVQQLAQLPQAARHAALRGAR